MTEPIECDLTAKSVGRRLMPSLTYKYVCEGGNIDDVHITFSITSLFDMGQYTSLFHVLFALNALWAIASAQRSLYQPCPLLGPFFHEPLINTTSSTLKTVTQGLNKLLDDYIVKGDGRFGPISPNSTSFSIALFAGSNYVPSPASLPFFYQYHHTANALDDGQLGKDSVFALGDLTQLFAVYTQLAVLGDDAWSRSIVDYVPELLNASAAKSDEISRVQWKDVTLGTLAGQMSGIARSCVLPDLCRMCFRDPC
jgi:hypothetical protein